MYSPIITITIGSSFQIASNRCQVTKEALESFGKLVQLGGLGHGDLVAGMSNLIEQLDSGMLDRGGRLSGGRAKQ